VYQPQDTESRCMWVLHLLARYVTADEATHNLSPTEISLSFI